MIGYILILFAHVGMMGSGNSNSVAMHEFRSKESCLYALKKAEGLSSGSTKVIKGECVPK
jgi:hypothetical protein